MEAKLEDIVGKENIKSDSESLKGYSWDQSFVEPTMPQWVVFPQSVEQIQNIVIVANQEKDPLIPFSSGLNLHGPSASRARCCLSPQEHLSGLWRGG